MTTMTKTKTRCAWADSHELLSHYHDEEWGVPVHDDRLLFEMLSLEGAQAGLSWLTVLKKREGYRKAFHNFDLKKVARFDARKQASLVKDESIIRNRLKINSVVENAKAVIAVQKEFGSFHSYLWDFVGGKPLVRRGKGGIPPECAALAKDLRKRGFRFVAETTCYAFMQAVGMVDDHGKKCFAAERPTH